MKLYTSVNKALMRKTLFRGMALAGSGVLLLAYSGSFIPLSTLKFLGLPLFLLSIFLISFGLLPYRKLMYLDSHPNSLSLESEQFLQFQENETPVFSVLLDQVEVLGYFEKDSGYGITAVLKDSLDEKILLHNSSFSLEKFKRLSKKETGADLFFPFFTSRAYARLGALSHKRSVPVLKRH